MNGSDVLTHILDGATVAVENAELDADTYESRELLDDALHHADAALAALHTQLGDICHAHPDRHGRCVSCGRLVARMRGGGHKRGGCLLAPAVWVAGALMPVPYLGKALWLLRRKAGV